MNLRSKTAKGALLAAALAFIAGFSLPLNAEWENAQDAKVAIYRNSGTGLEWSVKFGSFDRNRDYAQKQTAQNELHLLPWKDLRDAVNNSNGLNQLNNDSDSYEINAPITVTAWRGFIKTRRYRKWYNRNRGVGVRSGSDTEQRALSKDSKTVLPSSENNEQSSEIDNADKTNNSSEKNEQITEEKLGKLYVLSVWGTNAKDLHDSLEELQHRFIFTMEAGGLNLESECDPDKFVKEFILLSGDKASKKNVLETCRAISKRAQKNDVIFVYMCCHGITKRIDGTNKRYHVLFPGIKTVEQMQNVKEFGILRSEILKALNPDKHRLTALITDSGAKEQDEQIITRLGDPNIIACYDPGYLRRPPAEENLLRIFLRTNTGLVDWNSTSPFGGNDGQGEQSPVYRIAQEHEGVFFSSFLSLTIEAEDKKSVSTSELFNELKERLTNCFEFVTKEDDFKNSNQIFTNQSTQTLFDFKGQGFVIDDEKGEKE